MKRRPASAAMSLFSYLDGLVCTMGALILLLLLTTHRIREQVLADHKVAETPPVIAAVEEPPPSAELPLPGYSEDDVAARQQEIARILAQRQEAELAHQAELQARHAAWQAKLNSLQEMNQQLLADVEAAKMRVTQTAVAVEQADSQSSQMAGLLSATQERTQKVAMTEASLKQLAEELLNQRETSLKTIENAKVSRALRNPVFEIVTEDATSGTTRRPILLECTSDSVVFCSEGIRISAATLNEFTPEYNPLMAGTAALLNHWRRVDGKRPGEPGPYVLMIVRPGGTIGFYVARQFLEKLNQDFGYELVSASAQFNWPAEDPVATAACQQAIDKVLNGPRPGAMRGNGFGSGGDSSGFAGRGRTPADRYSDGEVGGTPPSRPGADQIVGNNGEFSLAEVDQLRNSRAGDAIDMLGPEWNSARRRKLGSVKDESVTNPDLTGQETLSAIESEWRSNGRNGMPPQGSGSNQSGEENPSPSGQPIDMTEPQMRQGSRQSMPQPGPTGIPQSPDPSVANWGRRQSTSGPNSSSSDGSRADPNQLPPPPLASQQASSKKWKNDGGAQRKWGRGQSNGAIGIERSIVLHLYPERFSIEQGPQMGIPTDMIRSDFQDAVAMLIESHAQTWGIPPSNYFWRPSFEINIHPGGSQHYAQLKELLDYWALSYKLEHLKE